MNYVTFDIETYSPSDATKIDTNELRVSVVGAYFSWIDKYIAFLEEDMKDFLEALSQAELVVGYNHLWFDLPVLQKYADFELKDLPSYDIMIEIEKKIGFKLKLNDVCRANLDNDLKTDSYSKYKNYHKEGKWLELIDYCMNDVRLTNNIFQQIQQNGKLYYYDLHEKKEVFLDQPRPVKSQTNTVSSMSSIF